MKMNNKGMSLVELLITLALIGIILAFLFGLLISIRNETKNNDFVYNNQINRTDAIYTIENDLNNYTLINLLGNYDLQNDNNPIVMDLIFSPTYSEEEVVSTNTFGRIKVRVENDKYYIDYKSVDGKDYTWEMKDAIIDDVATINLVKSEDTYYFVFTIELYNKDYNENNCKGNNNPVDDIKIIYTGDISDLDRSGLLYLDSNGKYYVGNTVPM